MEVAANERKTDPTAESPREALGPRGSIWNYRAWLVDLDGTLYRQDVVRALMAAELAVSGWKDIRTLHAFRREQENLRNIGCSDGLDPFLHQIKRTALQLGMPEDTVARIVQKWMVARPGRWLRLFRRRALLSAIAKFRAAGGKTAIVSDYPARMKLEAMGASQLFDVIVACGDGGDPVPLKPRPTGLLRAAAALGVAPEGCLVIGDRWDADGEAARQAGISFLHVSAMQGS